MALNGYPACLKTGRQLARVVNTFISALGRLGWKESKASLGYILRLCLKVKKGHQDPRIDGKYLAK